MVVSVHKEPVLVDLITLGYGEIEILGSCVYTPAAFAKSVGLLPLVSHRLPLAGGVGAIEQRTRGMDARKILLPVS